MIDWNYELIFMGRLKTIKLRKDRDYVYCFLQEKTILEEECNMYAYNIQCDEKGDVLGRTHRKGTLAGYSYQGQAGNVLNSCKYCLDKREEYAEYIIPQEAKVNSDEKKWWDIFR